MREAVWAGVTFVVLGRHDVERVRAPGLYVFAARDGGQLRPVFAGEAQDIAREVGPHHASWAGALAQGFNEVHVCLGAAERIDRMQLLARVVRAEGPAMNGADLTGIRVAR